MDQTTLAQEGLTSAAAAQLLEQAFRLFTEHVVLLPAAAPDQAPADGWTGALQSVMVGFHHLLLSFRLPM
jgi:hypothetical protein